MAEIDTRGKLAAEPFSFRVSKDRKVFILWNGKPATTLKDKEAENFIARISTVDNRQAQLLMARMTGHFKHGNERSKEDG